MRALSPRMVELLKKLHAGGINDKVYWLGGINAQGFAAGSLKSVTMTVLALQDRGLVNVVFNCASLLNGTVELTKNGITYMENLK